MNLAVFICAVFGIIEIIILGKPTKPIRRLFEKHPVGKEFIHCPLCLGFWIGAVMGIFLPLVDIYPFVNEFVCGCVGSGASYFLHQYAHPIDLFGEDD